MHYHLPIIHNYRFIARHCNEQMGHLLRSSSHLCLGSLHSIFCNFINHFNIQIVSSYNLSWPSFDTNHSIKNTKTVQETIIWVIDGYDL